MRTDRRGFLAALVLAPLGVKLASAAPQCLAWDIEAPGSQLLRISPYTFVGRVHDSFLFAVPRLYYSKVHDPLSWDDHPLSWDDLRFAVERTDFDALFLKEK